MARLLIGQRTAPSFFGLSADGEDLIDGEEMQESEFLVQSSGELRALVARKGADIQEFEGVEAPAFCKAVPGEGKPGVLIGQVVSGEGTLLRFYATTADLAVEIGRELARKREC